MAKILQLYYLHVQKMNENLIFQILHFMSDKCIFFMHRHIAYFYVIAQFEYYFLLDKTITTRYCVKWDV